MIGRPPNFPCVAVPWMDPFEFTSAEEKEYAEFVREMEFRREEAER